MIVGLVMVAVSMTQLLTVVKDWTQAADPAGFVAGNWVRIGMLIVGLAFVLGGLVQGRAAARVRGQETLPDPAEKLARASTSPTVRGHTAIRHFARSETPPDRRPPRDHRATPTRKPPGRDCYRRARGMGEY